MGVGLRFSTGGAFAPPQGKFVNIWKHFTTAGMDAIDT